MKALFVLLAGALAACQSPQTPPRPGMGMQAGSSGTGGAGTAAGDAHMAMHGHEDMCKLHQQMMSARTPEEREALMAQAMPDMPREARERHLQMMQRVCH